MSSPQAAGASALLLSAAKQKNIELTPADAAHRADQHRATTSTDVQAHAQGSGLINIVDAWDAIQDGATAHDYTVKAPVDTAIDFALKTPGFGTGLYDREGGLKAGQKKSYDVVITRTTGPDRTVGTSWTGRTTTAPSSSLGSDDGHAAAEQAGHRQGRGQGPGRPACTARSCRSDDPKHRGHRQADPDDRRRRQDLAEARVHLLGVRLGAAQQHQVVLRDRARGRQDPRGRPRRSAPRAARRGSSPSTRTASPVDPTAPRSSATRTTTTRRTPAARTCARTPSRRRASGRSRSSRAVRRRCSTTRTSWTSPCSARPSTRRSRPLPEAKVGTPAAGRLEGHERLRRDRRQARGRLAGLGEGRPPDHRER